MQKEGATCATVHIQYCSYTEHVSLFKLAKSRWTRKWLSYFKSFQWHTIEDHSSFRFLWWLCVWPALRSGKHKRRAHIATTSQRLLSFYASTLKKIIYIFLYLSKGFQQLSRRHWTCFIIFTQIVLSSIQQELKCINLNVQHSPWLPH